MRNSKQMTPALVTVPYVSLMNAKIVQNLGDDAYLKVDRHFFQFCLRNIISRVFVDEDWYLSRYPDIAAAVERGDMPSARAHYARFGYFEGRMPYAIQVDADWYLTQYVDVQEAIARKDFASAQMHFDEVGFTEGRFPYPRFTLRVDEQDSPVRLVVAGD